MSINIDVVIPVGPFENDKKWLPECVKSLIQQTHTPACVVFVDDMARLEDDDDVRRNVFNPLRESRVNYIIIRNPWRLGCADSWNIGIAQSPSSFALMMGADDWLESPCLAACADAYARAGDDVMGYYFLGVRYCNEDGSHTDEVQTAPCNAAMVSKALWRHLGGFPPEAGLGAPDAALISIMMKHGEAAGRLRAVSHGAPLYNTRRHSGQDTVRQGKFYNAIIEVRDVLTREWQPARWAL